MKAVDPPEPLPPGGAYELRKVPLTAVAPTPLNPRRAFGTAAERTALGESLRRAQLAPCVAMTRRAYTALWPEHTEAVGTAEYVLINGERRYRSALHVGLATLDLALRDDLATSREDLVNHVLAENLQREDFDVMERARGVRQLVDICAEQGALGAQSRAAARLGHNRSWVTNQLALLRLPQEIQGMLSSGELPEREGRRLARHHKQHPELSTGELLAHWRTTREQRKAERTPAPPPPAPVSPPVPPSIRPPLPTDSARPPLPGIPRRPYPYRPGLPRSVVPAAALLVRRLGTTPRDQARTLAAGLDTRGLRELSEALRPYL
ncbi:ParB/RepB/Spo0J family partition protein [Streptomyces luteireticuli]|uniref:ParB/RepB/Spo0J family partition protein n=1 Tax=Streptomyces luteireticuli TaxID=173858 RepID=UPI0035588781